MRLYAPSPAGGLPLAVNQSRGFVSEPEIVTLRQTGSLADAVKILKKEYSSKDRLWASWGDYDRRQFERVCKDQGVGYPFGPSHLNVKSLFAAGVGSGHEMGLDGAYKHLGLTMEGTHHRGDDDAWSNFLAVDMRSSGLISTSILASLACWRAVVLLARFER